MEVNDSWNQEMSWF